MNIAVQVLCSDDPLTEIPVQVQLCVSPKRSQDIYIPNWKTTEDWELQVENQWKLETPSGKPLKTGSPVAVSACWLTRALEVKMATGEQVQHCTPFVYHLRETWETTTNKVTDLTSTLLTVSSGITTRKSPQSLATRLQCLTTVACNLFAMSHCGLFQPVCNVSPPSLATCLQCLTLVSSNLFAMSHCSHFQPVCNVSQQSLPTCLQCLTAVSSNLYATSHHCHFQSVCNVLEALEVRTNKVTALTQGQLAPR